MNSSQTHDLIGIGFGPANLALAIAFDELVPDASIRFVEAHSAPIWQGAMLLDGADVQHHPCRDLVTLRNPRSRYTFINYLFETGRLVEHLNLPLHFPLRKEYARYIGWATQQFGHLVDFGERVIRLTIAGQGAQQLFEMHTSTGRVLRARTLCVGTGRSPHVPAPFDAVKDHRVFHSSQYLVQLRRLPAPRKVAVIGGSQSAVEVTLDLTSRFPDAHIELYTRAPGLALKDTSPFSERGFFPEFTGYYHQASRSAKRALDDYMRRTNYSCVDQDLLHRLYVLMHEQDLDGQRRVFLRTNRRAVEVIPNRDAVKLVINEVHLKSTESTEVDFVVVATGYRDLGPAPHQELFPPLLDEVISRFRIDDGFLQVNPDYTLEPHDRCTPVLILNGLCESSHGIGDAGSFSLLSLRAQTIVDGFKARGVLKLDDDHKRDRQPPYPADAVI